MIFHHELGCGVHFYCAIEGIDEPGSGRLSPNRSASAAHQVTEEAQPERDDAPEPPSAAAVAIALPDALSHHPSAATK
jgi:hypothetical protein